jgi:nickel-dependent lactate racemase
MEMATVREGLGFDLDAACDIVAQAAARDGWEVVRLAVVEPPPVELSAALTQALAAPIGSVPLRELARGRRTVAIITSDPTRAVPTAALLDGVVPELLAAGVPLAGIEVVVGVGAHRGARAEEMHSMLGPRWAGRLRIRNHDPHAADLVAVGTTPRGTRVRVDHGVALADLRIAFGQVEPHELAGFTGGRKAILPAVADYQTTLSNHALDMLESPFARPGVLDGNPIHEEMVAAARLAGLDFIINVVLDSELRPLAVAAGDMEAAHAKLVRFVRSYAEVQPPEGPVDAVVTGPGRPLDINLYQAIKSLVALEPLLAGTAGPARAADPAVILVAACTDGTGSQEMLEPFAAAAAALAHGSTAVPTCVDLLTAGTRSACRFTDAVLNELRRTYTIEMDHSYFVCRFLGACRRVVACCPGVSAEELGFFGWVADADPLGAWHRVSLQVAGGMSSSRRKRAPVLLVFPRPQRALLPRPSEHHPPTPKR